jgi:hypothetical protein
MWSEEKTERVRHGSLTAIACLVTFVVQALLGGYPDLPLVCRFGVWPDPRQQAILPRSAWIEQTSKSSLLTIKRVVHRCLSI